MNEIPFLHKSVLLDETLEGLDIKPDGVYVDGTAGGGGHSFAIASRLSEAGRLIAIDRDADAIRAASARLAPFGERVKVVQNNFVNLADVIATLGYDAVDGVLMDLGVSSYQLDNAERGFSYQADAPLDMRMDRSQALTAATVVNEYSEEQIKKVLWEYGEEKFSGRIAAAIARRRNERSIMTTGELAEIIKSAIPSAAREGGHHPAKRSFQAIRIEVNGELSVIEPAIRSAVSVLKPLGRVAIITFHSLEDRIVKETFADLAKGCTCPRDFPICVCGKKPTVKVITKSPIVSGMAELEENPRARSAKLRVAEKL